MVLTKSTARYREYKIHILQECGVKITKEIKKEMKKRKYEEHVDAYAKMLLLNQQQDLPSIR